MDKKPLSLFILILMILAALFSACGGSSAEESLDDVALMATAIEQTVQARMETQLAEPTATLASTETPVSIPTISSTVASVDCLRASLVSETVADGTVVQRGFPFTKTWKVSNSGTCTWTTAYKFVFVGGDAMGALTMINLAQNVAPGKSIDISLNMVAPANDAIYTGYWTLQSDNGVNFAPFTVQIEVGDPNASLFTVTNVTTDIHNQIDKQCPFKYEFTVNITSNEAGTVKYYVEDSIHGVGTSRLMDFTSAGTQPAGHSMTIYNTGKYWVLVYIERPNKRYFGPFSFNFTCP